MRAPKFSTVVNAGGFEMLVKGRSVAVEDAIQRAYERLERVSGVRCGGDTSTIETLPRTGDNISMRVTWLPNARA